MIAYLEAFLSERQDGCSVVAFAGRIDGKEDCYDEYTDRVTLADGLSQERANRLLGDLRKLLETS